MCYNKNQSQKYLALNYYYTKTNIFNKYFYTKILHNYLLLFNYYSFNLKVIFKLLTKMKIRECVTSIHNYIYIYIKLIDV